ncbi:universal stress protein [Streptomyces sp. NPDC006997]|uniref:universal stress protein n=1 Tax=Streptomyces sp. NPDC006997 TaxID=3155356 RepID=UPI0033D172F4
MTAPPAPTGRVGTVIVGVDDTSYSWLAAEWAAAEALLRGDVLRVVHAVGPGDAPEAEARVLDAAASVLDDARARIATARPALRVDTVLGREEPADALLSASRDADLVVVGTRGRGGFAGLLLGSVSLKVAAHADCPVVITRGHPEKPTVGEIVVGVRDAGDEDAVRFALAEAERRGVGVRLVHAWTPAVRSGLTVPQPSQLDDEQRLHERLLRHAARPVADHPHVPVDTELSIGPPAAALVDASARAALVVLPRHPPRGLGLRLGSVVHAVLHHADCPVAVVPTAPG